MKLTIAQDSSLSEALSSLNAETLRKLELHLEAPYGRRMQPYGSDLARREDLIVRTEMLWRELERTLTLRKAVTELLRAFPSRSTWLLHFQLHRTARRIFRQFHASRLAVSNC